MFLLSCLLGSAANVGARGDYPPGTAYRRDTTHMDVFMALFMMCTLEVLLLKVWTHDQNREERERDDNSDASPASRFFDRD